MPKQDKGNRNLRLRTAGIFDRAYGKYGVGAFNVFNAEQIHGVFKGASDVQVPVIIQITPVARGYMNPAFLEGMISAAEETYEAVDFSLHLDHGNIEHCIATDMRLVWTRVHREFFKNSPELFDPVLPGNKYMEELREFVKKKCLSMIVVKP